MSATPDVLAGLLVLLRDVVREAVREELRADTETFDSRRFPPDCGTARRFAEECRKIPEATKRGRVWIVPKCAWEAHRTRRRGSSSRTEVAPVSTPLTEQADRLLVRAGLRVVGAR
jgi:hypothetical protein